jgi:sortase A
VARQVSIKDLSVEQLRLLMLEKIRAERQMRLENYRRTGRAIIVEAQPSPSPLEALQIGALSAEAPAAAPKSPHRVWFERVLFLVEVAAVIGLALILLNGLNILSTLNQEVSSAMQMPTLQPTPLVQAVVLPSGHTPPQGGATSPNEAEIPEHLRPMVQSLANLPVPTPGVEQAVRVQIPALGVDAPVVQGDGWEQLKKGVGQHAGTANPGEAGNLVLSAHNDVFGEIFRDLDQLKPGDPIIVFTQQRTYTYIVAAVEDGQGYRLVEPTQVEVMSPTRDPALTLISCYPYMVDNQRIVVRAYLQESP